MSLQSWFDYLLAARDINIVKELEDVDTMERQVVNFLCEVNHADVDGRWYRDDCRIRQGDNIKIRHQGKRPTTWDLGKQKHVHAPECLL